METAILIGIVVLVYLIIGRTLMNVLDYHCYFVTFGNEDWEEHWYKWWGSVFFPIVMLYVFIVWVSDLLFR